METEKLNDTSSMKRHETRALESPTKVRYLVLLALALAVASAYLTRVMSAASTTIQREFGLSNEEMGYILSGFFFGYIWFQLPGGWIANRFGTRMVLPALSILWSVSAIWISVARSGIELRSARIALGLAQAGLVPCCVKVLADWFPVERRGVTSAVLACSMQGGAVLGSGLTANLLPFLGWRGVFHVYSAAGIVWAIIFYLWFRNRPDEHPSTNRAEQGLICGFQARREIERSDLRLGWRADGEQTSTQPLRNSRALGSRTMTLLLVMLTSGSLWAICGQAVFRAFGYEFFTTWFPAFLERGHGVKVVSAGMLTMIPLVGVGLGSLFGGFVVDAMLTATGNKWLSRSGTAAGALCLCALCTLAAVYARNPLLAVTVISVGSFFSGLASPATWAAAMDISGNYTAVVAAIMNMSGTIGAFACPIVLGYLFSYIEQSAADWNLVLYLFVGIYFTGALCWLVLNPNQSAVERPTNVRPQTFKSDK